MKARFFLASAALLCLLFLSRHLSPVAEAQEGYREPRRITTSGEARIWIEPDRARVFLGIETMKETVNAARDENAAKMKKVMAALKGLNIQGMLIKAPIYSVSLVKEPEHDATRAGRLPKIIGYRVIQDFTVLLRNEDVLVLSRDAARVLDTALNNGVNIIQRVNFFKEDDSEDKRKAMRLAVEDAVSKAKVIAGTAGVSIKEYTYFSSHAQYRQPSQMTQMYQAFGAEVGAGVPTTLVAGKISIWCSVQLNCDFE